MNNSAIKKGLILNGNDSVAIARIDDAVYRLQPIPEITPLSFENFEANKPVLFDFSSKLPHDYQVIGVLANFIEDDYQSLGTANKNKSNITCRTEVRIFRNGVAVASLYLNIGTYLQTIPPLFISKNDTWEVKCRKDMNGFILMCAPIITNAPITLNGVESAVGFSSSNNNNSRFNVGLQAT